MGGERGREMERRRERGREREEERDLIGHQKLLCGCSSVAEFVVNEDGTSS